METSKAFSVRVENGKVNFEARFVNMGLVKCFQYLLNGGQIGQL